MMNYKFENLNDKEFECLVTDLLSVLYGERIERFKSGRDGGVDGRFFSDEKNEAIIQCKHWIKSGTEALLRSLKSKESVKVKKLQPSRYIFVTSLELSRENKKSIKRIFDPFLRSESDIFGNEDLNQLLSENKEIERRHYKLWITSTATIQTIFNNAILGRSLWKLEEIIERSKYYAITSSYREAVDKLHKVNTLLIIGSPGIGKTFLSDQLCLKYAAIGYELFYIENSLNEAEEIYSRSGKQIFYFDDFLGSNFLKTIESRQDSHLINFIKRVNRDRNKKIILTSRINILNRGKLLSEVLRIAEIDANQHTVEVQSPTHVEKAKILYNHIWMHSLEESYRNVLYEAQRYLEIIKHRNFNPRLISFIVNSKKHNCISPERYWEYITTTLSNPQDIWDHVFNNQVDRTCVHLVIAITLNGNSVSETGLQSTFKNLLNSRLNINLDTRYESATKVIQGALITKNLTDTGVTTYTLFEPSIADFIISSYLKSTSTDYIAEILVCLRTHKSLHNLSGLIRSKAITQSFYEGVLNAIFDHLLNSEREITIDTYKLHFLLLASATPNLAQQHLNYMKKISRVLLKIDSDLVFTDSHHIEFIKVSLDLGLIPTDDKQLIRWLQKIMSSKISCDVFLREEFQALSEIIVCANVSESCSVE